MAIIKSITISNFRNLNNITLKLSSKFNLFYGDNGSGKTSLLESIYFIALGKSFRAQNSNKLIQHNRESLCLFVTQQDQTLFESCLGIEKNLSGERKIKLDGAFQSSITALTRLLPLQFMSPISYRFFHDGPKIRRQHLDWALFHVEPSFHETWKQLQRTLKQRNSALKHQQDILVWTNEFIAAAELIDEMRQSIFAELETLCLHQLNSLLPKFKFELKYKRGWPKTASLKTLLAENLSRDKQLGYTYYGPQRADLQLTANGIAVVDILSQGQQKLASYALHLGLGSLLQKKIATSPIYLIDDLPSELDKNSRIKITQTLQALNAQVFITGISCDDLSTLIHLNEARVFHMEHGITIPHSTEEIVKLNTKSKNSVRH